MGTRVDKRRKPPPPDERPAERTIVSYLGGQLPTVLEDRACWAWVEAVTERQRAARRRTLRASDYYALLREMGYIMVSELSQMLEHRLGTDGTLSYTCRDAAGDPVDLSAATLSISVRPYPGGTEETLDLAGSASGSAAGVVTQAVAADELLGLSPGDYAMTISASITVGEGEAAVTTVTCYPLVGTLILRLRPRGD